MEISSGVSEVVDLLQLHGGFINARCRVGSTINSDTTDVSAFAGVGFGWVKGRLG